MHVQGGASVPGVSIWTGYGYSSDCVGLFDRRLMNNQDRFRFLQERIYKDKENLTEDDTCAKDPYYNTT